MKKKIKLNFFSKSNKWHRRIPKIKKITYKTVRDMQNYFYKRYYFNLNLIFYDKRKMIKLNKKYKNKNKDTDVLTFVSEFSNKEIDKTLYCDIFFSIETIEKYLKKNKVTIYEHYNHLLIHSILHISGYNHDDLINYNRMKKEEIKILNKNGIQNPYTY